MAILFDTYRVQSKNPDLTDRHTTLCTDALRRADILIRANRNLPEIDELRQRQAGLEEHLRSYQRANKSYFSSVKALEKLLDANASDTQVILADNVAQYFYESSDRDWSITDFPVISPPFPVTWIEFSRPQRVPWPVNISRWALWTIAGEIPLDEPWDATGSAYNFCHSERLQCDTRPRWLMRSMLYCKTPDSAAVFGPLCLWFMALDDQGSPLAHSLDKLSAPSDMPHLTDFDLKSLFYPGLLTLTLMHCKNVSRIDVSPSASASKQWQKKHGEPLRSFKTLNIKPLQEILRGPGGSSDSGLKMSLHICRGHFRDYRQHGLFGKHKGIYWWDSFVRGDEKQGTVVKDYAVQV